MRYDTSAYSAALNAEGTRGNLLFTLIPFTFGAFARSICYGLTDKPLASMILGGLVMTIVLVMMGPRTVEDAVIYVGQRTLLWAAGILSVAGLLAFFVLKPLGCVFATIALVTIGAYLASLREVYVTQDMQDCNGERFAARATIALIPTFAAAFLTLFADSLLALKVIAILAGVAAVCVRIFVPNGEYARKPATRTSRARSIMGPSHDHAAPDRRGTPRLRASRPNGQLSIPAGASRRPAPQPRTSGPAPRVSAPGERPLPASIASLEARRRRSAT